MKDKYAEINQRRIFADKLQAARKAAGLTQEGLADRMGVSVATVKKWCSGAAIPDGSARQEKLAAVLGLDYAGLFGNVPRGSERQEVAAEYVGLSIASVDVLRALSSDQRAALDKILAGDPAKLLAAVSAAADAIQETARAAALVSQAEKDLDAVHHGQQRAEDLLREDLAELRLLQHTQPLKTQRAGRALEDLLEAVAPPVSAPARILDDEAALACTSSARLDFLDY